MWIKLTRPWYVGAKLYEAGVREIPDSVLTYGEDKKPVLPKGAEVADGPATDYPATHPTLQTLSEIGRAAPQSGVDALTRDHGPTITVADQAADPKGTSKEQPAKAK